jgi:hypothetical protein
MNKHLTHGIIVGTLFAIPITWIATLDAVAEGDALAILATFVFGLAAGVCVGALIAANFAMLALEDKAEEHTAAHEAVGAHAHGV